MANKKISALSSASTPLAGTEVLPIVQSSATVQVSVANLTTGRDISTANITATNGAVTAGSSGVVLNGRGNSTYPTSGAGYFQLKTNNADGTSGGIDILTNNSGTLRQSYRIYEDPVAGACYQSWNVAGAEVMKLSNTGNLTLDSGNLVQGTAAKGINFTANTAASGMTSQLLNWYEEGTWTPAGNGITFSTAVGRYVRVGRKVDAFFAITFPTTANGNDAYFTGLPFTVGTDASTNVCRGGVAFGFQNSTLTGLTILGSDGQTSANFRCSTGGLGSSATQPTNAQLSAVALIGTFSYLV